MEHQQLSLQEQFQYIFAQKDHICRDLWGLCQQNFLSVFKTCTGHVELMGKA